MVNVTNPPPPPSEQNVVLGIDKGHAKVTVSARVYTVAELDQLLARISAVRLAMQELTNKGLRS